jgi:hypothetical protein
VPRERQDIEERILLNTVLLHSVRPNMDVAVSHRAACLRSRPVQVRDPSQELDWIQRLSRPDPRGNPLRYFAPDAVARLRI